MGVVAKAYTPIDAGVNTLTVPGLLQGRRPFIPGTSRRAPLHRSVTVINVSVDLMVTRH